MAARPSRMAKRSACGSEHNPAVALARAHPGILIDNWRSYVLSQLRDPGQTKLGLDSRRKLLLGVLAPAVGGEGEGAPNAHGEVK